MAPEADTNQNGSAEDAPAKEPIYARGPALRVPDEAVQLTFLELDSLRRQEPEDPEDSEHPGLELKTALGITLPVFEGPLDLLLYLIRRDELDVYDIPIGRITENYLEMLGLMKVLDLEVAGEFLVMAATLMRIKARMLLPTWPDDEEDEEDPRSELMRQLLEYRRFKAAASDLQGKEADRARLYGRGFVPELDDDVPVELEPMSYFVLVDVMKDVLARVGEEFFYEVELEDVTLEEKIALVETELAERGRALFVDLISRTPRRIHIVVTFMAILELSKLGRIALAQEGSFSQIWIYPVSEGKVVTEAAQPGDPVPTEGGGAYADEPEIPTPDADVNEPAAIPREDDATP